MLLPYYYIFPIPYRTCHRNSSYRNTYHISYRTLPFQNAAIVMTILDLIGACFHLLMALILVVAAAFHPIVSYTLSLSYRNLSIP